jgi:hypothetical protein
MAEAFDTVRALGSSIANSILLQFVATVPNSCKNFLPLWNSSKNRSVAE